ncbi:FAD-binding oxidoreductase [Streptomyces sp. NPDC096153]|uniref:FAD-binding oxidoreductase n=1 Tax=Streptomyces sp. NPDC096153 TaxID=3155548 RepID=UPI00331F4AEF
MRDQRQTGAVEGTIVRRGDDDYEALRTAMVWNGRKPDRFPELIVRAASERDVPAAVRLARSLGLRIAVRSTGHSWCGSPVRSDSMLLDLSALRRYAIDPGAATAYVQPAVTGRALAPALAEAGLAFPVAHCGTVAVGGYLLGGGLGWNSGALGPACHSVEEIEAVTADGETVRCNERENADLFWAARGAGPGFFAAVTGFRLHLHPAPGAITTTMYAFPLADVEAVCQWATEISHELEPTVELALGLATAAAFMTDATPRPKVVTVAATAFAADLERAADALRPLGHCPFADGAVHHREPRETSFADLYETADGLWSPRLRYAADTLWSDAEIAALLSRLGDAMREAPSDRSLVLAPFAPASHDGDLLRGMAFSVLGETYAVPCAVWDDPSGDEANIRWLRDAMASVEPLGTGHYIAEADLTADPARAERSFRANDWERLQSLRARHDPDGLFHGYLTP